MKYFAKIRYLGGGFHGFQVQPGYRTVQGELCAALEKVFGAEAKVTGCSRTDAGVHADCFCLSVECDAATVPPDKLPLACAAYLPPDLSLYEAHACSDSFHPRYDVISKEYTYRILNSRVCNPFLFGRCWFLPRNIPDEGLQKMQKASLHFLGKHDFSSFVAADADTSESVRDIKSLSIERSGDEILVKIRADGFLYNMVRIIVGTLTEVAFGRIEPDQIPVIIESRDRSLAGPTAPPDGLYLSDVSYPENPIGVKV